MQKIVRMTFVTNDGDDKTIVVPESRVIAESSVDLKPGIAVEITVSDFGTVRVMLEDDRECATCPFCFETFFAPPKQDPLKRHIDYCPQNPGADYGMGA